jgi:hypothetical protein
MKAKLLLSFLILSKFILAQIDSSKAVVFFKPQDAIVYLDGKKIIPKQQLINISVGYHKIQAWAPKYELFSDSFLVKKNENRFYSKKLRYSEAYKIYRTKKRVRFLTYTVPVVLAIGFGVTYHKRNLEFDKRINQTYNDALELQSLYNTSFSPSEFQEYYDRYNQKVTDYKDLQGEQAKIRKQGIVITSVLAGTALTVFIIQMVRKKTSYSEVPLLARVKPGFNPLNKQLCLTINLY